MPKEERHLFDVEVVEAFTLDSACAKVGRTGPVGRGGGGGSGDDSRIDIRGAYVVLDCLTDDIRHGATPAELLLKVARTREEMKFAGAAEVVVCEVKPMELINVIPFNQELSDYLRSVGGFGCNTQIRVCDLRDGLHVKPDFETVIDRTYACAIRGVPVPCPTPPEGFISMELRRRWEAEWPRLRFGGPRLTNHGRHW